MPVRSLISQLRDSTLDERIEAARLLQQTPDPERFESLLIALEHPNDVLACEAARALVALNNPAARGPIARAYKASLGLTPIYAKDGSLVTLIRTHIADRRATSLSLSFVRCHDDEAVCVMLTDPDQLRRSHAAWALGERRSAQAIPALKQSAASDPDQAVRDAAEWALQQIEQSH
jgi:HEAT repeat protein